MMMCLLAMCQSVAQATHLKKQGNEGGIVHKVILSLGGLCICVFGHDRYDICMSCCVCKKVLSTDTQ